MKKTTAKKTKRKKKVEPRDLVRIMACHSRMDPVPALEQLLALAKEGFFNWFTFNAPLALPQHPGEELQVNTQGLSRHEGAARIVSKA